jgi:uncharacterized membrane protein YkoI
MILYKKILALAFVLATATSFSYADKSEENDALAITKAKTSLAQAIATAELHAKGKATHAEFEDTKNAWVYEVEVVSGKQSFDVTIDAEKGSVISSVLDVEDENEHHDKKD